MNKQILFIHGGGEGAYEEDRKVAANLQELLGAAYNVRCPKMPNEGSTEFGAWKGQIAKELIAQDGSKILVGHFLGGSLLLKYLSEEKVETPVAGLFLIAPSYWGLRVGQPASTNCKKTLHQGCPKTCPLSFTIVAMTNGCRLRTSRSTQKKLPQATFHKFNSRGHQLNNDLSEVARDIMRL